MTSLYSHDIFLFYFSRLSNRSMRKNIKSLETGASLYQTVHKPQTKEKKINQLSLPQQGDGSTKHNNKTTNTKNMKQKKKKKKKEKKKSEQPLGHTKTHQNHSLSSRKHIYIILTTLTPTFILKNWGLQGYTFFLFLLKNIDCGYSLEPPQRGGSNEYPQSMF